MSSRHKAARPTRGVGQNGRHRASRHGSAVTRAGRTADVAMRTQLYGYGRLVALTEDQKQTRGAFETKKWR